MVLYLSVRTSFTCRNPLDWYLYWTRNQIFPRAVIWLLPISWSSTWMIILVSKEKEVELSVFVTMLERLVKVHVFLRVYYKVIVDHSIWFILAIQEENILRKRKVVYVYISLTYKICSCFRNILFLCTMLN